ncbi:TMhelix containing protein [Vibrio phage 1.023.O._10N.222.51.B4]|nr:TMhelix containing protein [Vibrio phage 1.023.O._10N.222.51.B4]
MIKAYLMLAIYLGTLTYLLGVCFGKFKMKRWVIVGLTVSYASFGLAYIIELFLRHA